MLVFLYANLTFAARTAAPDVLWELEDQLGLPGRVIIEPLIRRFLPVVVTVIALASGLRATAHWETVLGYLNATPFGTVDPLFGRDLGFFVFELPLWRLVYGWAMTLVVATIVLTLVVYVLQRSLVLTSRGPRLAGGRPHAPARARRLALAPQGARLLARPVRAGLLAARHRVRRLVHRHPRVAAGPGRARGRSRRSARVACLAPDRAGGAPAGRRAA